MAQKEKLEEAKRLYQTANADQRYVLESLFPELKESEDEKIRKELIFYLRYQHSISENFEDIGKWITWLEKQGKKNSVTTEEEEKVREQVVYAINKLNVPESEKNKLLAWLEKQGEQKPAWSEEDERNLNDAILFIETGTYSLDKDNLINWLKSLRPQPKQEWSEEDDWIKTKIIKVLLGCETFLTSEETNECIDWIKSIKQRLKGKS